MKKILFITLSLCAGYPQCNEFNWQDYYNSDGWNMEYCDLAYANLAGENLSGAWLWGANLSGADLEETDLSETNLTWANLAWADLTEADLSGADLSGAAFEGANLDEACLENTINFTQINYFGDPIFEGCGDAGGGCAFVDETGDGYDDVSYLSGYIAGHSEGVIVGMESVDITTDNEEAYNIGFAAGRASADTNSDGHVDEFPTISIVGGSAQTLIQGSLEYYLDSGATCSDQEDGVLSHSVEVSGSVVNINNPGAYIILYNCSDSDGNAAQTARRTVFVLEEYMFLDTNADNYDDISYAAGAQSGDVNQDGMLNIIDVVIYIDQLLNDN